MIDASQMREVITDTLNALGSKYADPKAIDLVYNTGLVESKYVYIKQIKGPAVGHFQIEPWVGVSTCNDYLKFREPLMKKVAEVCYLDSDMIIMSLILALIHNTKVPDVTILPNSKDEMAIA